jgi:hypothetical protein
VVLRLAPDTLRGEVINVGIVLFSPDEPPRVIMMAPLNKLRAIDSRWDSAKLTHWRDNVEAIVRNGSNPQRIVSSLSSWGFCDEQAVGLFSAGTKADVAKEIAEVRRTYVAARAPAAEQVREPRTRLQAALRKQFKLMHVLGKDAGELAEHKVIANVPVPDHPAFKADFVYKNGVYRVTQTLDYFVSPESMPQKLAETCLKAAAVEMAEQAWGPDTQKFAVVHIPEALRDVTDDHLDLLLHKNFQIFHFGTNDMDRYLKLAAPIASAGLPS